MKKIIFTRQYISHDNSSGLPVVVERGDEAYLVDEVVGTVRLDTGVELLFVPSGSYADYLGLAPKSKEKLVV